MIRNSILIPIISQTFKIYFLKKKDFKWQDAFFSIKWFFIFTLVLDPDRGIYTISSWLFMKRSMLDHLKHQIRHLSGILQMASCDVLEYANIITWSLAWCSRWCPWSIIWSGPQFYISDAWKLCFVTSFIIFYIFLYLCKKHLGWFLPQTLAAWSSVEDHVSWNFLWVLLS